MSYFLKRVSILNILALPFFLNVVYMLIHIEKKSSCFELIKIHFICLSQNIEVHFASVDAFLNYTGVGEVSNGRINSGCCVQKNMCVC